MEKHINNMDDLAIALQPRKWLMEWRIEYMRH